MLFGSRLMGRNIVEKLLHSHLISGEPRPGQEVAIRIDQCLTQDATGTMAYLQFESMGLDRIRAELAVSYVDHNTIQVGFGCRASSICVRGAALWRGFLQASKDLHN